ncbi:UNVERIFIED_CONTAM: hypothetical protein HDU68_008412 [Siphonaria sp. JEL0065]|nr:hypothetical protein HDU68_008412 [Siphonaria sp. JEL0065]
MPIGHSPGKLAMLNLATFLIDAIPITSCVYSVYQLYLLIVSTASFSSLNSSTSSSFALSDLLALYCLLESFFLVYFFLTLSRLQVPIQPPLIPSFEERRRVFFNFLSLANKKKDEEDDDECDDSDVDKVVDGDVAPMGSNDFRAFFAPWFVFEREAYRQLKADEFHLIRRDDFRDWFAWLLYSARDYKQLSTNPSTNHLSLELDSFLSEFESRNKLCIQPGSNRDIQPVILSYNPILAYPKPLVFYACISLVESIGHLYFSWLGFRRIVDRERRYSFHPLDQDPTTVHYWVLQPSASLKSSVATSASLPPSTQQPLPIVFFHGIGCGLFPYAKFIAQLAKAAPTTTIFLVELPHVAMRFVDHVPSMEQTVAEVESMLDQFGFKSAMVVGHSLGSASLNFIWHQSILWADDLPENHHVVISRKDLLVDARVIEDYFLQHGVKYTAYDLDHGEFLFTPGVQTEILERIVQCSRLGGGGCM